MKPQCIIKWIKNSHLLGDRQEGTMGGKEYVMANVMDDFGRNELTEYFKEA